MTDKNMIMESFKVKGMTCNSCVKSISRKVSKLEGVDNVHVDLAKDNVKVDFNPKKTSLDDIKIEIAKLGYKIDGVEAKRNIWEGIMYGLIPHIGCIAFIICSVLGVTVLMQFFKPLLMSRYIFHILILISIGFATLSSLLYLRKNGLLSFEGAKKKWKYLATMYGSTVGINIVLFFFIFPLMANVSFATTGDAVSFMAPEDASTLKISVDIPCPGHAPLITNELKTIDGVQDVQFSFPNNFDITYDAAKTSKGDMLVLDVFNEYPATVLEESAAAQVDPSADLSASTPPGCCGSSSCTANTGGTCGGSCGR